MGVLPADLAFAFSLADAADAVARHHFRSEAIRTTTKTDGTPVSQVDLAVEQAMLALVRGLRPGDAVRRRRGRAHAGTLAGASGWRWVFDGIDGTHNYAAGRPGWSTIIAAELDGEPVLGLVSAPLLGRRWWAIGGRRGVERRVGCGRVVRSRRRPDVSGARPPRRSTTPP